MMTYTALGHWLGRRTWTDPGIDIDLTGRRVLVTGANAGLGLATTHALVRRGAHVIMACRSVARGQAALDTLDPPYGRDQLSLRQVDLADLAAVSGFADALLADAEPLHVLINNAGVMLHERQVSPQGHELTFATNVLAGFMLTQRLSGLLARSGQARVINVTSGGMYTQRLQSDDLQSQRPPYHGVRVYAQTKRAQVILTEQWATRLASRGVTCNAMHPGWAATPGVARSMPRFNRLLGPVLRDADQGADTVVWLAASAEPSQETGGLFFDRKRRTTHLTGRTRSTPEARRALWDACTRLTAPWS
ncbi:MAG: dehydrogenase/reductase SDR family protein 12 [Myxococcota bacterium]|jgi:dehydrogenase/reductase SDR family protein 12